MNGKRKGIIPMGKWGGYLAARRATKSRGGLPSNARHDECLVRTVEWRQLGGLYPAWTKEVVVHPEKGGQFKKWKDVVDSETGWVLPAKYIPEEAIGRKGVGLFIDPDDVREENGRIVVHPKPNSIVVLRNFIQRSGHGGKVDEDTRMPLRVEAEVWRNLSGKERRWLNRINGVGVRPLHRDYGDADRRNIDASFGPECMFGVAYVGPEEVTAARLEASRKLLQALG